MLLLCGLAIAVMPALAFGDSGAGALRAAAGKLLADGSADDAIKAADLLDKASQIEARTADQSKSASLGGTFEQLIANGLAPLVSTIVLGGTLVFNIYQMKQAEREKRRQEQEDDAQAREDRKQRDLKDEKDHRDKVLGMLQSGQYISSAALGMPLEGPYHDQLREAALIGMSRANSMDNFKGLYDQFMRPLTYGNLDDAVSDLRDCHRAFERLWFLAWDDEKKRPDITGKLTPMQIAELGFQADKRDFLNAQVVAVLRQPRPQPPAVLDLTELGFVEYDLSNLDFHLTMIGRGVWRRVNLAGCDFRSVTSFENFAVEESAWWEAAHIDPPLLAYLDARFGYDTMPWVPPMVGPVENYRRQLDRLKAGQSA